MIYNIIQSVTEKLSSLPFIEGIVLGGSRARGTHTEDSDIDIGIYYNPTFRKRVMIYMDLQVSVMVASIRLSCSNTSRRWFTLRLMRLNDI